MTQTKENCFLLLSTEDKIQLTLQQSGLRKLTASFVAGGDLPSDSSTVTGTHEVYQ